MVIMCNELVGMYQIDQYVEFERNIRTMAADFSGPDAQGQMVWVTLASLGNLVQEQRGARIAARIQASGGDPAAQPAQIPWITNLRSSATTFICPPNAPQPAVDDYVMDGGGGGETSSSSVTGSPTALATVAPMMLLVTPPTPEAGSASFADMPPDHHTPSDNGVPASEPEVFPPHQPLPAETVQEGTCTGPCCVRPVQCSVCSGPCLFCSGPCCAT